MSSITRLVNRHSVEATDLAVHLASSPRAAAQPQPRKPKYGGWKGLFRPLLEFDPITSSSILLPRSSPPWSAPASSQAFATRLAETVSLSNQSALGVQVANCLLLATRYPQARALSLLQDLETVRAHATAACARHAVPDAVPLVLCHQAVRRVLHFHASGSVDVEARVLALLAVAGLVMAGQATWLVAQLREFLADTVLRWEPLQQSPLAQRLLDDFLDLQWPADPARELKQAIHEAQGRGRAAVSAPAAPTHKEPQSGTIEAETLAKLRKAGGAFVANLKREPVARLRRRGWKIESVKEARSAGKPIPPNAKGHRLLGS